MKVVLGWTLAVIAVTSISAQTFSLIDADVSNFPRVRVQFLATDPSGQYYTDLRTNDFSVRENGRSVQASLSVSCEQSNEDPTAHVVLVVDRSRSMLEIVDNQTGETRWEWVKAGVAEFLRQFPFTPPSSVALISFAGFAKLESDFRTSAQPILDALDQIRPDGSTKYDQPLLDASFGAIHLLSQKPRAIRRIIVFLTDGQPDTPPQTDTIIARCKREAITFYAITVGLSMNSDLDQIARATGGKSFAVFTKERLKDIYKLIALESTLRLKCYLEWIAPWSCSEQDRIRNVEASFLRPAPPISASLQYIAPPQSIAKPTASAQVVYFGNPNPGNSTTQQISITAVNAPLRVTGLPIIPPTYYTIADWGGKTVPFTLQAGESWTFTVRFTQQGSKQYRQATLTVDADPCPITVTLIGGLSRALVISPNGGEIFSTCDSIDIRWAGVEPTQRVEVYYTLIGAQPNPTWQLITRNATGYSLRWKPPQAGQTYRIRVIVPPDSAYQWAKNVGGASFDTCRSIVLDNQQMYVYVAGTFTNSARVEDTTITSAGESDMFLARFDSDGNLIWIRNGGGNRSDYGCCLAIDPSDNIYVTGNFRSPSITFGGVNQSISNANDISDVFITRYNSNGNAIQAVIGGGGPTGTCEAYADSIAFSGGSIYVYGRFRGRLVFSSTPGISINSTNNNTFSPFTAILSPTLGVQSLQRAYIPAPYTRSAVRDTGGNRYEAGGFTNQLVSGPITITSNGGTDAYIRKFGITPGSLDLSDTTFKVVSPLIRFRVTSLDVDAVPVGDVVSQTFSGTLCNEGEIPVIITSMTFSGPQAAQFQIVSNLVGYVLKPGECVSVEVLFRPIFEGTHTATLTVQGNCGNPAQVNVSGIGLPPCKLVLSAPHTLYTSVGSSRALASHCLLRNDGSNTIQGTIRLTNNPNNAFQATVVSSGCTIDPTMGCPFTLTPGQCLTVTITFSPTLAGTQSAQFDITVPSECGETLQQPITGVGLAPQVELRVPAFGPHRVNTTTTLQATLSNTSDSLDAIISSITLRNPANPHFQLSNIPQTPFTLAPRQQVSFTVSFAPQAEGDYSEVIEALVQGIPDPVAERTTGTGILPKIEATDITFSPTPVGVLSGEIRQLIIRNTSTTAPLTIKNITIPANPSFWFVAPPATPITIPIGDSLSIDVRFQPAQPGLNSVQVQIVSDAAPGPELDPSVTTTVTISGIGLALQIIPPQDFGDVLLCESILSRTITITNPSDQEEIITISVSGDVGSFAIDPSDTLALGPGSSGTITIRYTPTLGQRSITLTLTSSALAQPYTITLTANGVTKLLQISVGSANIDVGKTEIVPMRISTDPSAGSLVHTLELQLSFTTTALDIDDSQFQTQQNGWTWTLQHIPAGAILRGTSALGIVTGFIDVSLPITTYISTQLRHAITPSLLNAADYPCLVPQLQSGEVIIPYYCAQETRQITLVSPTAITLMQSTTGDIVIDLTIGLDMPYRVDIFSSLGTRVLRVAEGSSHGVFTYVLPAGTLPPGMYFVRLASPLFSESQPVLIVR